MISFSVDGVVLDIEGTVSSIDFVHRRMFPYVRRELESFLTAQGDESSVRTACRLIAQAGGLTPWESRQGDPTSRAEWFAGLRTEVLRLMDADAKSTGLKMLQGLIWEAGFQSGELVAPIFSDVVPALRTWTMAGIKVVIYSSGSVAAQKLFFGHTDCGDLRPYLSAYFDTTTGSKREAESYSKIALASGIPAQRLVFISDIAAELEAASAASYQVALSLRPGNSPQPSADTWAQIERFDQINLRT